MLGEDGQPNKMIGDISEMENIPFPWKHVFYVNDELVNYEYVITENVGIGTASAI